MTNKSPHGSAIKMSLVTSQPKCKAHLNNEHIRNFIF